MMRFPLRLVTTLLIGFLLFALVGCEEGPVGPPGPPGPPGDPAVFSFTVDFQIAEAAIDGPVASVQYDAPEITERVVQNGAVMAYFREQGTWTALPYTYGVESPDLPAVDYTVTLGYAFETGFLEVFYEASSGFVTDELPDQLIKVVVIESFAGTRSAEVDLTDYNAVANHFGLQR
jgi:hypothetical protein